MHRLLLVDALRRMRWYLLGLGAIATQLWLAVGSGLGSMPFALAASMALAVLAGPMLATQLVAPREVQHLPISRAQLWRTRLWITVVGIVCVMGAAKLAGVWTAHAATGRTPRLDVVGLSAVLDFAYVGAISCLLPAVQLLGSRRIFGRGLRQMLGSASVIFATTAFATSPFLPLMFYKHFPAAWSDLSWRGVLLIGAGLAMSAIAYLVTPRTIVHPSPVATRAALAAHQRSWVPTFPRVTGIRRLFLKVGLTCVVIQAGVILIVPTFMMLFAPVFGEVRESWLSYARTFDLLPFEASDGPPNVVVLWILITAGQNEIDRMFRHLRTLPFTVHQLNAVLLSLSAMSWTIAWLLLTALHLLTTGDLPHAWRLGTLLGFAGAGCLARALQVRWQMQHWFILLAMVVIPPLILITQVAPKPDLTFAFVGLLTILVAAGVNHSTLTRSRKVYAPSPRRTILGTELPN